MNRGLLVTEFCHSHGDLAVDVTLVCLGYHLVNEVLNVGSGGCKLWCVIKHHRVGSLSLIRSTLNSGLRPLRWNTNDKVLFRLVTVLFFFKRCQIKLLKNEVFATCLKSEGVTIHSLEGAYDAARVFIVADDRLVPLVSLVGQGVGRDEVSESQRDIVDDDVDP